MADTPDGEHGETPDAEAIIEGGQMAMGEFAGLWSMLAESPAAAQALWELNVAWRAFFEVAEPLFGAKVAYVLANAALLGGLDIRAEGT